jgi:hypothetical protein
MSVVFCVCNAFFDLSFHFLWNDNKSTAFTSKQHLSFLSHDGFHRGTKTFEQSDVVGKCDEKFSA